MFELVIVFYEISGVSNSSLYFNICITEYHKSDRIFVYQFIIISLFFVLFFLFCFYKL